MKRRDLLAAAGVAAIAPLSGCLDAFSNEDEGADYATLTSLRLYHWSSEGGPPESPIEVRIDRDDVDEFVYEHTYEVGEDDVIEIDCVWPDELLRVSTRPADQADWQSRTTAHSADCVFGEIRAYNDLVDGPRFAGQDCSADGVQCHGDGDGD